MQDTPSPGSAGKPRGSNDLKARVKILIADDSLNMHRAVIIGLRNEPVEVIAVDNGEDALRLCREHKPRVVLADVDMPGMTGIELCKAIRREAGLEGVQVALICDSFNQTDESALAQTPADGKIWKPFESQALVTLVNTLLKAPRHQAVATTEPPLTKMPAAKPAKAPTKQPVPPPKDEFESMTDPELERQMTEQTFREAEASQSSQPADEEPAVFVPKLADSEDWQTSLESNLESNLTEREIPENEPFVSVSPTDLWGMPDVSISHFRPPPPPPETRRNPEFPSEDPGGDSDFEIITSNLDTDEAELPMADDTISFEGSSRPPPPKLGGREGAIPWSTDTDFSRFHDEKIPFSSESSGRSEAQGPAISQEQVKRWVQEEIAKVIGAELQRTLQQQLAQVISEIDAER